MRNKKGALPLIPLLLIFFVIGLIFAWSNLTGKYESFNKKIGEKQFDLINTYQNAEKSLFYTDQSAKYSAQQAIYNLAKSGGCNNNNKYFGYSIWNFDENSQCNPITEIAKNNFLNLFSTNLNEFLSKYESVKIPLSNYDLDFRGNNIIGLAIQPLKIPIENNKNGEIGVYSIKPSFKVSLDYDFSDYDKLRKKSEELIEMCKDKNFELCVNDNKFNIFNNDDFELLSSCEPEEKENFYKVVEYVESCSYSEDKSCICTQNNPSIKGSYDISQDGNDILIMDKNNMELKEKIENVNLVDNYVYVGDASYVHKDQDGKVITSGYWTGKTCSPEPKTEFRFCVESKNNKFYAYDESEKTVKLRPVVYKFALDFGEQKPQEYEIPEVAINDEIKNLFRDKNIIIAAECRASQEEIFALANELGILISQTEAQVIVPVGKERCNEINDLGKYKSSSKSNILIALSAFSDEGFIEYNKNRIESKKLAESILNQIFHLKGFSEYAEESSQQFLSTIDLSAEIIFGEEKIKEKKDYAKAIFAGIVNYMTGITFEYKDVEKPSGKRGLIDLEWAWQAAKAENVNYHLLLAVIETESSFDEESIGAPYDYITLPNGKKSHKAHGFGQHFPDAIHDIYLNYPKFSEYENLVKDPEFADYEAKKQEFENTELKNYWASERKKSYSIYQYVFTSTDEGSLKAQITATALYLKWTRNALSRQGKPTDTKTIIMAYHDGVGNINIDGTSKLKDEEAQTYVAKVENNYREFTTAVA